MGGGDTPFIRPNVSHCIAENEVHYNPMYVSLSITDLLNAIISGATYITDEYRNGNEIEGRMMEDDVSYIMFRNITYFQDSHYDEDTGGYTELPMPTTFPNGDLRLISKDSSYDVPSVWVNGEKVTAQNIQQNTPTPGSEIVNININADGYVSLYGLLEGRLSTILETSDNMDVFPIVFLEETGAPMDSRDFFGRIFIGFPHNIADLLYTEIGENEYEFDYSQCKLLWSDGNGGYTEVIPNDIVQKYGNSPSLQITLRGSQSISIALASRENQELNAIIDDLVENSWKYPMHFLRKDFSIFNNEYNIEIRLTPQQLQKILKPLFI